MYENGKISFNKELNKNEPDWDCAFSFYKQAAEMGNPFS